MTKRRPTRAERLMRRIRTTPMPSRVIDLAIARFVFKRNLRWEPDGYYIVGYKGRRRFVPQYTLTRWSRARAMRLIKDMGV